MNQHCFDIISNTLQRTTPSSIKMHKIEKNFILDIDFDIIIKAIEDDLNVNGYCITEMEK